MKRILLLNIGQLFRAERLRQGLRQSEISGEARISRTQVTNIENENMGASVPTLINIAAALGYNIEVVLVPRGRAAPPRSTNPLRPHRKKLAAALIRAESVTAALKKLVKEIDS